MDRRELLTRTCGMGACSCLGLAWPVEALAEDAAAKPSIQGWQVDFLRARMENLLEIVVATLDEATQAKVLARLGRACGQDLARQFKGNPEGFWAHAKTMWLDRVEYDQEKGVIHVMEKPRTDCNCPLSTLVRLPRTMCSCSIGTQEAIYESLFNRPVTVKVEESVLQGGRRCAFTIILGSTGESGPSEMPNAPGIPPLRSV